MSENKINIANIIAEMCGKAKISQGVISGIIGKTQARVSSQLQGDSFLTDEVYKIAEALNCKFVLHCECANGIYDIDSNERLYELLEQDDAMKDKIGLKEQTFKERMEGKNLKMSHALKGLSVDYEISVKVDMFNMTDRETLYQEYYRSGLSEEARLKKNERQREYNKQQGYTETGRAAVAKYRHKVYQTYQVNLRRDEDAELIQSIEDIKAQGIDTTEAFRILLKKT